MALNLALIPAVNLLFSALIVMAGLVAYGKTRKDTPLYLAGAFLLLGLSSFAALLGAPESMVVPILAIQVIGYILVLAVLYRCYAKEE